MRTFLRAAIDSTNPWHAGWADAQQMLTEAALGGLKR